MARLFILLFVLHVALAAVALIGCLSTEKGYLRVLPRLVWAPVIIFLPILGSVGWFLSRRPNGLNGLGRGPGGGPTDRMRPHSPDDDPEFLRALDAEQSKQERELFRRWEEDLRRREGEIARREADDPAQEGEAQRRKADDISREDHRPDS